MLVCSLTGGVTSANVESETFTGGVTSANVESEIQKYDHNYRLNKLILKYFSIVRTKLCNSLLGTLCIQYDTEYSHILNQEEN